MDNFNFWDIRYRKPLGKVGKRCITEIIGIDAEAYRDGKAFMFCLEDGKIILPEEFPDCLFTRQYRNKHFCAFNLKYEAGAFLQKLPLNKLRELRRVQKCEYRGFLYRYFPHKFLRITKGKNSITFWDVAVFYKMRLGDAAEKYLGEKKLDQDVTKYNRRFVKAHWKDISKYCIHDAKLAGMLMRYLLKYLHSFGVKPNTLYSPASVSFMYFKKEAGIVDVWRYWRRWKRMLQFWTSAYAGGKFEMTRRGKFTGQIWDIASAYPYEIANLKDITNAKVTRNKKYMKNADFGVLKVMIDIPKAIYHPIPYKMGNVNIFPIGIYTKYITKQEYEYLAERGFTPEILCAYWLKCRRKGYPYRKVVMKLWKLKSSIGDSDEMKYELVKTILNGFYGKMVQLIRTIYGTLRAGAGWNPIYAATITANVRIRMAKAQEYLGDACYAVHTDSVLSTKPLPKSWVGKELGDWTLKREGSGVVILCGVYQIGKKSANRGFKVNKKFSWKRILAEMGSKEVLHVPYKMVISWIGAVNRNKPEEINRFVEDFKKMRLNCDVKRVWPENVTGKDLLTKSQKSTARIIIKPF